jgi:hypothetical protein
MVDLSEISARVWNIPEEGPNEKKKTIVGGFVFTYSEGCFYSGIEFYGEWA